MKPGQGAPASSAEIGGGCVPPGSETDFEECLSLTRSVRLTRIGATVAVRGNEAELAWSVLKIIVQSRPLAHAADLHAVENVKEFHAQLRVNMLSKVKVLCQAEVFIGVERIAELADNPRFVALSKAGVGKCRLREHRKPLVVVIVVHVQGDARIEIGASKAVQEGIVVARVDSLRSTADVLENSGHLPAADDVLG